MKINFIPECHIPATTVAANEAYTATLALPLVTYKEDRPRLAVVGGGWSVEENIKELQEWDGDVWACGSGFQWCLKHGIKATFFLIDPAPRLDLMEGVQEAILANCCHPSMFETGANVQLFELITTPERSNHGVTTMTAAPELAMVMGYTDVSFFGGDSSFTGQTHTTYNDPLLDRMMVKVGEDSYLTCPELLMQAELLATIIRMFPHFYRVRGTGLLNALIDEPEYDITHLGGGLLKLIEPEKLAA